MSTEALEVRVVAVETFTDEEIGLLSGGAPMVVTPYLDTLDPAAQEATTRTAFRGLVARGIIDPPSVEALEAAGITDGVSEGVSGPEPDGRVSVDLGVRGDVMSVMTLRDAAESVIAVARTATDLQDYWYAHVVDQVTLIEEVSPHGLHRLTLAHTADLPALLGSAVLHPGAIDGTGAETVLSGHAIPDSAAPPDELLQQLGRAYLRADVVVLSRTDPDAGRGELLGLFTGPEGSWSLVADPATATVRSRPETLSGLQDRLASLVARTGVSTEAVAS